ncbi:MAG: thioredoxin domain-containing protein, partial [Myxococcota bacterium]
MTLLSGASAGLASSKPEAGARRNHLAGEASPYLQMHVYNPVDWYPWGPEAFEKAKREDKPIFLSVGYSTCYWCHVMEREVFSNPEIAKLMNASFVSVKVDREERPDIDEIYMQATHLLTRSGGWPNSVFLTPNGKPFFAGTYFPPEDRGGRPGFPSILNRLSSRWNTERDQVLAHAERVAAAIQAGFGRTDPVGASFDPMQLLARGVDGLAGRFDEEHGGFGSGTKFPSPHQLELLLAAHQRKLPGRALEMLRKTLDEMATGGIYDHLAGGFHRYSTERTWSVPHFEKMLYDNAQLLGLYARAHKATGDPLYRRVAEGIADYLAAEMTSPMGGLYSAQDAEVDSEEGASYVWTAAQIQTVLGAKSADALLSVYQLVPIHRGGAGPGALRVRL